MCYNILTQTEKVIFVSTVQRITNIELSANEFKENFVDFDSEIH